MSTDVCARRELYFVVSTNERAVATWRAYGFEVVGTLPDAFRHPQFGFIDALAMYKQL